eukprot:scaffold5607_cov58-Phaeocystis_antarctica.AAC.1
MGRDRARPATAQAKRRDRLSTATATAAAAAAAVLGAAMVAAAAAAHWAATGLRAAAAQGHRRREGLGRRRPPLVRSLGDVRGDQRRAHLRRGCLVFLGRLELLHVPVHLDPRAARARHRAVDIPHAVGLLLGLRRRGKG